MRNTVIIAIVWNVALYLMGGWSLVAGMLVLNMAILYGARYLLRRAKAKAKLIEHTAPWPKGWPRHKRNWG